MLLVFGALELLVTADRSLGTVGGSSSSLSSGGGSAIVGDDNRASPFTTCNGPLVSVLIGTRGTDERISSLTRTGVWICAITGAEERASSAMNVGEGKGPFAGLDERSSLLSSAGEYIGGVSGTGERTSASMDGFDLTLLGLDTRLPSFLNPSPIDLVLRRLLLFDFRGDIGGVSSGGDGGAEELAVVGLVRSTGSIGGVGSSSPGCIA